MWCFAERMEFLFVFLYPSRFLLLFFPSETSRNKEKVPKSSAYFFGVKRGREGRDEKGEKENGRGRIIFSSFFLTNVDAIEMVVSPANNTSAATISRVSKSGIF